MQSIKCVILGNFPLYLSSQVLIWTLLLGGWRGTNIIFRLCLAFFKFFHIWSDFLERNLCRLFRALSHIVLPAAMKLRTRIDPKSYWEKYLILQAGGRKSNFWAKSLCYLFFFFKFSHFHRNFLSSKTKGWDSKQILWNLFLILSPTVKKQKFSGVCSWFGVAARRSKDTFARWSFIKGSSDLWMSQHKILRGV